jgi:UDP-GlcNAc3NAcA epimerase
VVRIVSVLGNRPQFVKAAAVHAALAARCALRVIDTGQHYDHGLAGVFYDELGLSEPDVTLGVGSGRHGAMTGRILDGVEHDLVAHRPDWVVVFGDTNSTIAAALAATKLGIRVAHVEAGLRSFDWAMPEEVNRVITDRIADLLFCPSVAAADNLGREAVRGEVRVVGDVMADVARLFGARARGRAVARRFGLEPGGYAVATIHREANTREPALSRIVHGLSTLPLPVVAPLHPRTRRALAEHGLALTGRVIVSEPLGYLDFASLLGDARALVTDSGGAQKEAYFAGVPCVTLRRETEWVETVATGWNRLVGDDPAALHAAVAAVHRPAEHPVLYGDGFASERIADAVCAAS